VRELRGFRRVPLAPGETKTVRFPLAARDLAFYAADMRRVVEPGAFTVWVGGSSIDGLEGHFSFAGDTLMVAPAPPRFR
jgi:beta-glucosidase